MALFNYECDEVKRIIEEVSPNYPQLTTYEKEWLYFHKYGYFPGEPVELEYETVLVKPTGSVSNAIPHNYKNAILKGNTIKNYKNNLFDNVLENGGIDANTGKLNNIMLKCYRSVNFIPINGNIKIAKYGIYGDLHCCFYDSNKNFISSRIYVLTEVTEGNAFVQAPTGSSFMKFYNPYNNNEPTGEFRFGVMTQNEIIELELQSVQMPVLRTTGKNLFNINIFKNESDEYEFPYEKWKMQLKPNTTYIANSSFTRPNNDKTNYDSYGAILNGSKQIEQLYLYHWNLNLSFVNKIFTTDDTGVIYLGVYKGDCPYNVWDMVEMQIEEGSTATPYEPYKSNILTVNEDLTLRSNGDVYDELNLLTGRLTQRIGENNEVLAQEVVKTVALAPLNKPYEGTNHYELTANIPCEAILEVPVVSTGKQTLEEIND